jgi:2-methylcitrate dehydratase PrpD
MGAFQQPAKEEKMVEEADRVKNPTASEKIGAFVEAFKTDSVSAGIVQLVGRAFADTFGVAVAGREEGASRLVRDYVISGGLGGPSTIWATGERVRPEDAALVNATMAHVLDYDDVTNRNRLGHPSTVSMPALVALGEAVGATGAQIAAAYAAGFEVVAKVPHGIVLDHYERGFHAVSTIGGIRAAVSCAHLLGLNASQTVAALGILMAHLSGLRCSFGTMCKSIQAANASAVAIRAARLARAGFTGSRDAMDGPGGFAQAFLNGESLDQVFDTLGEAPLQIVSIGLGVKKYPCCYTTHHTIQGLLDMMAERPIRAADVERVNVTIQRRGLTPVIHKRPRLGLEGKFSMEYAVAAAILDNAVGLRSFTDAAVQRPEAQELLRKVEAKEEETWNPAPRRALVEVVLKGGETRSILVEKLRGSGQLPLTDGEMEAKLRDCVAFSGLKMDVDGFLSKARSWHNRTIGEIVGAIHQK